MHNPVCSVVSTTVSHIVGQSPRDDVSYRLSRVGKGKDATDSELGGHNLSPGRASHVRNYLILRERFISVVIMFMIMIMLMFIGVYSGWGVD